MMDLPLTKVTMQNIEPNYPMHTQEDDYMEGMDLEMFENYTYFYQNRTWIFGKAQDVVLLPILLLSLALISVITNFLVIFAIVAVKRMHTGPNLMLINISVCDLILLAFCIPTAVINHASTSGLVAPPAGNMCHFTHYVLFVTTYVSIYTLVVACVFRFSTDFFSGNTTTLLSRNNAVLSCIVIWLSFLLCHLHFVLRRDEPIFQESFICVHRFAVVDFDKMRTVWVTFLTCAFLVPLVTVLLLSALTLCSRRRTLPPKHVSRSDTPSRDDPRHGRQLTILIMLALIVRSACWLPIQIFVMTDIFGGMRVGDIYRKAEMMAVCLAFASTCFNLWIYNSVSREFRLALFEALEKLGCKCPVDRHEDESSDMNETIMSIISDSSNHINYT